MDSPTQWGHVFHTLLGWFDYGATPLSNLQSKHAHFTEVCKRLGVPLALKTVEGPSTSLTFLGIILDTSRMEICLPDEKLLCIRNKILNWLLKKNATKRETLSLVGLLQHASKVVRCGCTFVGRMYKAAATVKELSFFTFLTKEFRSDLFWWHFFLTSWNGLSLLRSSNFKQADCCIQTDASGLWGCGAVFGNHWFQWPWPVEWNSIGIVAKELAPIVIGHAVWGPYLKK